MLKVPEDVEESFPDEAFCCEEASIIGYRPDQVLTATPVLVTRPTFVLIHTGTKQLTTNDDQRFLVAPAGSVVVMRSGTHLMSEFHGKDDPYYSHIFSVHRSFVREAVGVPEICSNGKSVVVSKPSHHAKTLFERIPEIVSEADRVERQFRIRELLIALMGNDEVRELVLKEAADWGNSDEDRIVSIVASHYLSPINVSDFAKLCAMSLSSFKRHFQAIYGMPPAKWITQKRLEYAHSLVIRSKLSISEIGRASGYLEVSSFVRAFRRNFKLTPTALRLKKGT